MAQKKTHRPSADDPEVERIPLQAVLLADSFAQKFRPITLERPKVLLPLVNAPMIDYTLAWLESVGVDEVFVFCCAHSQQVKSYLENSQWTKQPGVFSVATIESHDAISAGDALRVIHEHGVIRGDFILISGDTVSNMSLAKALYEHKERRKKDPHAVMTMIIKQSKPSVLTHQTRLGDDEIVMAIDPETKELLYYEDKVDLSQRLILLDKMLLVENGAISLHNDKQDCYVDICSLGVLDLFVDNFDYQHLRRHFVKGLLVDDIMGCKIFTHEIQSSYAARVDNFKSYDTISKDIVQRWTYPFVPDVRYLGNGLQIKLDREGIYKAPDVVQSRSAHIDAFTVLGNATTVGDNTKISNSVIGQGCIIGHNVVIEGSFVWDNVTIEDGCKLSHALICDGVHLREGVILEPGVIISFKVEVGQNIVVPTYSKVSLLPQPSKQDSDEELEYADSNTGAIESTSMATVMNTSKLDFALGTSDANISGKPEFQGSGPGYIWSSSEGGTEEECRQSIAPIPAGKLLELLQSKISDNNAPDQDMIITPASGELLPDSESTFGDGDDDREYVDFEKEVEATFQRGLTGVEKENVILEINSLRLSCNMEQADCAGALFHSIMKQALVAPYSCKNELYANTIKEIIKWGDLLKHYLTTTDEEFEVILKFEDICSGTTRDFAPLFSNILTFLYDKEILSEKAILSWAQEKEGADESDKIFTKQAEQFIKWLREAPEEDDEDDADA
ncbi:hypothetical protein KSP40_PGU004589 [Platanthera guangdongensis]|uniref:Translation initiation factor eIF2B subunit epsilon n=1 Tax=Platanthera guangdongensis TaxID=2320717 RepID=A0ABR2LF53_9ASPA